MFSVEKTGASAKQQSSVTIRKMEERDIGDAAGLLLRVLDEADKDLPERIEFILNNPGGICLAAERNGEFAGCLLAHFNGFQVMISHLAVKREHRDRGIGAALHSESLKIARQFGARRVIADTRAHGLGFFHYYNYRVPEAVYLSRDIE